MLRRGQITVDMIHSAIRLLLAGLIVIMVIGVIIGFIRVLQPSDHDLTALALRIDYLTHGNAPAFVNEDKLSNLYARNLYVISADEDFFIAFGTGQDRVDFKNSGSLLDGVPCGKTSGNFAVPESCTHWKRPKSCGKGACICKASQEQLLTENNQDIPRMSCRPLEGETLRVVRPIPWNENLEVSAQRYRERFAVVQTTIPDIPDTEYTEVAIFLGAQPKQDRQAVLYIEYVPDPVTPTLVIAPWEDSLASRAETLSG